jgi:large subunit ribosomal protein L29
MDTEKIRNLGEEEIKQHRRQSAEQLFRLRFQMKLGQNEGVKKLRELRKEIARINTVERERVLATSREQAQAAARDGQREQEPAAKPRAAKPARKGRAK